MKLAVEAELDKLAMELGVTRDHLAVLEDVGADGLRELRHAIALRLDAHYRPAFQAIDKASRLLPNALSVKIAMRFFSPLLLGNVATELTADRAAKLLPLIPVEFLADCVPYLDPVRSGPLVASLPLDQLLPTTREVIRRRDHITMGRMLGALPTHLMDDVVPLVTDGRDLLLIGFHTEDREVLTPIVAAMSDDQCAAMMAAAEEHELVAEAAYVASHLDDAQRDRLRGFASAALRATLDAG